MNNPTSKIFNQDKNPIMLKIHQLADAKELMTFTFRSIDADNYFFVARSKRPLAEVDIPPWVWSSDISINLMIFVRSPSGIGLLKILKSVSFAKQHIDRNQVIFAGKSDYQNKARALLMCLYPDEVEAINNLVIPDINPDNPFEQISMASILKLTYGRLQSDYRRLTSLLFPGGHPEWYDRTLLEACKREVKEEVGIECDIDPHLFVYHNIYDMFNERYYNNIVLLSIIEDTGSIRLSSELRAIDVLPLSILPPEFTALYELVHTNS